MVIVGPVRPTVGQDVNQPMVCVLVHRPRVVHPPEDPLQHLPHDLPRSPPLSRRPPPRVDNPLELPLRDQLGSRL
jgi:hypothetical protein